MTAMEMLKLAGTDDLGGCGCVPLLGEEGLLDKAQGTSMVYTLDNIVLLLCCALSETPRTPDHVELCSPSVVRW